MSSRRKMMLESNIRLEYQKHLRIREVEFDSNQRIESRRRTIHYAHSKEEVHRSIRRTNSEIKQMTHERYARDRVIT
jgi:hypothetical protein